MGRLMATNNKAINVICIALPDGSVRWDQINTLNPSEHKRRLDSVLKEWIQNLPFGRRKELADAQTTTGFVELVMREEDFEQLVKSGVAFGAEA